MTDDVSMEYRVLGTVEARRDGREVALGGAKQRALLAMLLLHRGKPVSTDALVDALWPGSGREEGVRALHVAVLRLRRALGGAALETRAPGYALRVADGALDAERFEREFARGRQALERGDAGGASRILHSGLALWRGPALADLVFLDAFQAEAARLEELRLGAVEDAVQADLGCGRHRDVVGDLERLVAEHPLRERLRGQLMLALYRSGRQCDALAAYREARAFLVEQLGVEPGRELRALHHEILGQEAALEAPPPVVLVRLDELYERLGTAARAAVEAAVREALAPGGGAIAR
jgi:DNA-binding SARP family transcriptional activator